MIKFKEYDEVKCALTGRIGKVISVKNQKDYRVKVMFDDMSKWDLITFDLEKVNK